MHPFRNLLAALILFQHNVKILHWNLVGVDFDPVHQLLGDYYDQLGEFIDDIAETSIQLEIPPVGLTEAFDILNGLNDDFVALEGKEIFTSEESFNSLGIMFEKLLSLYETAWIRVFRT